MGRELLYARIAISEFETIAIGNTHLESLLRNQTTRLSQLQTCFDILNEQSQQTTLGAFLVGDMNLYKVDESSLYYTDISDLSTQSQLVIEGARSNRSTCVVCKQKIQKDSIRIGRKQLKALTKNQVRNIVQWSHEICFNNVQNGTTIQEGYVAKSLKSTQIDALSNISRDSCGLPPNWRDIWLMKNSNSNSSGFTYDGRKNSLVPNANYQSRFDRIYYHSKNPFCEQLQLKSIIMIGEIPIGENLFASDHFGLFATFDYRSEESTTNSSCNKRKRCDYDNEN